MTLLRPQIRTRRVSRYQLQTWGLAAGLLAVLAGAKCMLLPAAPPPADAYFARVLRVAAATPARFGYWVSADAPVPQAAVTMLRPNIIISKRYTNLQTGQQASFLLVQCSDAASLQGHYPPICYPAHGFKQTGAQPRDWQIDSLAIHGTVYDFISALPDQMASMVVYDFMILPDGRTCPDMDSVRAAARNPQRRQLGAAQLQVLVDPSMPTDQRDALFLTLVQAQRPVIDAILSGDSR